MHYKKNSFRLLVALILMMCCTLGYAQNFEFEGLGYEVIDESNRYVKVVFVADTVDTIDTENTETVKIPSTVTRGGIIYTVTSIGERAFYHCYGLTSISIPSSVKSIGKGAFDYCYGLTTITLPKHITNIDKLGIPKRVRIIRQ